jgi:hypothetical protein
MIYYQELLSRLQEIPGIKALVVVNNPPLTNVDTTHTILGRDGKPDGDVPHPHARRLLPGGDRVGQFLGDPGAASPVTVVGVVKDTSQMSYERGAEGELYQSYQQYILEHSCPQSSFGRLGSHRQSPPPYARRAVLSMLALVLTSAGVYRAFA